jgi:hypothetical protein
MRAFRDEHFRQFDVATNRVCRGSIGLENPKTIVG